MNPTTNTNSGAVSFGHEQDPRPAQQSVLDAQPVSGFLPVRLVSCVDCDDCQSDMFRVHRTRIHDERRKTLKLELQIRSSLYRLSAILRTMHDELSLLPVCV